MKVIACVPRQTTLDTQVLIVLVHVLKGRSRRRLAKVDELVAAVAGPKDQEAAPTKAAVVHADNADAEDGADEGVDSVAAVLEQLGTDLAADGALRGHGPQLRRAIPNVAWRGQAQWESAEEEQRLREGRQLGAKVNHGGGGRQSCRTLPRTGGLEGYPR